MSRKKQRRAQSFRASRRETNQVAQSGPRPDALTVAGALAVLTAFACEIGVLVVTVSAALFAPVVWLTMLGGLLYFGALVVGGIGLLLLAIVVYRKQTRIPRAFEAFAIAVGGAPWLFWLVRKLV